MGSEQKPKRLVSAEEQAQITRTLLEWLNTCESLPAKLDYEYLPDEEGLSMMTEQAAYYTARYILGGYAAEYTFRIVYRSMAENTDQRMAMDEVLNIIGAWAEEQTPPDLGDGIHVKRIRRTMLPGILARYDDGVEDHHISLTLQYEVINNG